MDPNRINCDDALDNANPVEVGETSNMMQISLQPIIVDSYPGELFYPATDVILLLSEIIGDGGHTLEYKKGVKKTIGNISMRIFEAREEERKI